MRMNCWFFRNMKCTTYRITWFSTTRPWVYETEWIPYPHCTLMPWSGLECTCSQHAGLCLGSWRLLMCILMFMLCSDSIWFFLACDDVTGMHSQLALQTNNCKQFCPVIFTGTWSYGWFSCTVHLYPWPLIFKARCVTALAETSSCGLAWAAILAVDPELMHFKADPFFDMKVKDSYSSLCRCMFGVES